MDKEPTTTDIPTSGPTKLGSQWDSLATYEAIRTAPEIGDEETVEELAFSMGIDDLSLYDLPEADERVAKGIPLEEVEGLLNEQRGYSVNKESLRRLRALKCAAYAAAKGETVLADRAASSPPDADARAEEPSDEAERTPEREGGSSTALHDAIKRNIGVIAESLGYTDVADVEQTTNLILQRVIEDSDFWARVAVYEGLGAEKSQVAALKKWLEQKSAKLPPNVLEVEADPSQAAPSPEQNHRPISIEFAQQLLSYEDVAGPDHFGREFVRTNENAMKYVNELVELSRTVGMEAVIKLSNDIRKDFSIQAAAIGFPPTVWGRSVSWSIWDIAKQSYLVEHPDESSAEYTLGDPFGDDTRESIARDISNRHLGSDYSVAFEANPDIIDLLPFPDDKKNSVRSVLVSGERNDSGQLRSFELTRLGAILRSVERPVTEGSTTDAHAG